MNARNRRSRVSGTAAREALRRSFRPEQVRVLFVGEAPSASSPFFYEQGATRNRVVQRVFESAFDKKFAVDEFLGWFARAGCYLEDLSHTPLDRSSKDERDALYKRGTARLAATLAALCPAAVVTLLRRVAPSVRDAIARAGIDAEVVDVPYPGRWPAHRVVFDETLARCLRRWRRARVLVLPPSRSR